MKKIKKFFTAVIALCLCFCLAFSSSAAVGVETNTESYTVVDPFTKVIYNLLDMIVNGLVRAIAAGFPAPDSWDSDSVPAGFMEGTGEFIDSPVEGASWKLGYDSRSILPDEKDVIGKMYVGGTIAMDNKYATDIEDDLRVRTAVLDDGSGRGVSVFCVIDAYGLALPDVREIRTRLSALAEEKSINSITISVMHQHSAVDTFGMNGNIWKMVLLNPGSIAVGLGTENGKNPAYMENLYNVCTESVEAAVGNMAEGKLYLGKTDASKYTNDKRQPYVMDPNFNRLRFVPADGSKETWLVSSPVHCVGNGAAGTVITGDYPYYAEKEVADEANLMFYLGAEQSTTQESNEDTVIDYDENASRLETLKGFGKSIGRDLKAITEETEVAPLLNIAYKEVSFSIDNSILLLAGKAGLFENAIRKVDGEYKVISEIGYMEIGEELAFAIVPGELAPELAYGGCLGSAHSWSGDDWEYPSMQDIITENGIDRELHVLGLANDQIGYIVPDNNYIPMLHESSQSIEFVSLGKHTASDLITEFGNLVIDRAK